MQNSIWSPENIAQHNKRLILDVLRQNGSMSRADLSRHLNMSFPAISSNAKGLLEAGYIMEVGAGDNSIGRKSTMLAFNAQRGFIIGVDWGRFRIRMMLADLLGNEVMSTEVINNSDNANVGQERIRITHDQIIKLLEKSGKSKDDILCIVIGIPGIIYDGVSSLAPFTEKFHEKDLIGTLQESFEADVILENCVNLGAIGEKWKGAGASYKDITYIAYGIGLGAAHILGGNLYKGATDAAGEIGFMLTDPVNISNKYDEAGSLEQMLSISKINHYLNSGNFYEEIKKLIQKYKDGEDMYAKLMIDEIAMNFGIMLVNIVSVLNPEIIIIAGGLGYNFGKLFLEHWQQIVKNHFPYAPKLVLSELNHTETMLGAVMTGITRVHEYEIR